MWVLLDSKNEKFLFFIFLFIFGRLLSVNMLFIENDIGKEDGEFLFIGVIDMDVMMISFKFEVDIFEIRRDVDGVVESMVDVDGEVIG